MDVINIHHVHHFNSKLMNNVMNLVMNAQLMDLLVYQLINVRNYLL